jgi:hypothetical protein
MLHLSSFLSDLSSSLPPSAITKPSVDARRLIDTRRTLLSLDRDETSRTHPKYRKRLPAARGDRGDTNQPARRCH